MLTDIDGNTYIDFAGAIGTLNVGHSPARVVQALKKLSPMKFKPVLPVLARCSPMGNSA